MNKRKVSIRTYVASFFMVVISVIIFSNVIYFVMWESNTKKEVVRRIKDTLKSYEYFITALSDKLRSDFLRVVRIVRDEDLKKNFGNVRGGYYYDREGNLVYIEKFKENLYKVYYLDLNGFLNYIEVKIHPYILIDKKPVNLVYVTVNIYGRNYYLAYPHEITFSLSKEITAFHIIEVFAVLAIAARFLSRKLRIIFLKPFHDFINYLNDLTSDNNDNYIYIPSSESNFKEIDEIRAKLNDTFLKVAEKLEDSKVRLNRLNKRVKAMARAINLEKDTLPFDDTKKIASELIKTAVDLMQNADAGSVYIVKGNGYSRFLTSWGYNNEYLEGLKLPTYRSRNPTVVKWKLTNTLIRLPQEVKWILKLAGSDKINVSLFVPITVNGNLIGELWIDSFTSDKFDEDEIELAGFFASLLGILITQVNAKEDIQSKILETIRHVVSEIELGKPYTEKGHTENVIKYSVGIAKFMGLDEEEIEIVRKSAAVHDVGKILISTPDFNEEDLINYTSKILSFLDISNKIINCAYHCHERFDGKGCPDNLSGEEIPLCSRIIAVADAFDDMVRKKIVGIVLNEEEALRELERGAGNIWDPEIVKVALKYFTGVGST